MTEDQNAIDEVGSGGLESREGEELEQVSRIELDDATLEPEALVEQTRGYEESEAIQGTLTELVDVTQEAQGLTGPEAIAGEGKDDPAKHYSAVSMATGDVLQDQDWNEGGGTPAETVAKIDSFTQEAQALTGPEARIGEGKDDPAKRYSAVSMATGDVLQDQDWNEGSETPTETVAKIDSFTQEAKRVEARHQDEFGLDFKPIPAGETGAGRSPSEGVSKIDAFTHEISDREASRQVDPGVALDGKGGDVTGAQVDSEAAQDSWKVEEGERVIPKLEMGAVGPDLKFFKVDISEKISGTPLDAKDPAYLGGEGLLGSRSMEEVLGRAVTDPAFRQELTRDAESALAEFDLTDDEIGMLSRVDPEQLEEIADQLQSQFEGGEDQATREAQGRMLSELLWGSDTEGHMPGTVDVDGVEHEDSWKGE